MSRRRLRSLLPTIFAVMAMIGIAIAYILWPVVLQHIGQVNHSVLDLIASRGAQVFVVTWFVWVGTSIGSFLNVVAWRMPRGDSINGRSICPRCGVQLRARDNFPVFAWLALGGRCRSCHLPISVRYPIVEAAVGLSVTIVAAGEFFQAVLPFADSLTRRPIFWDFRFNLPVTATLLFHVVALSLSWAMGLIRMDGNRLPTQLLVFAGAGVLAPALVYPTLTVVPWQMNVPQTWRPDGDYLGAILRVITALAAAIFLARGLAKSLCPTADPKVDPLGKGTVKLIDLIAILTVPILIVGWQVSVAIVVLAALNAVILRNWLPDRDALGHLAISMPVALTIQIVIWRWSHEFALWPSEKASPWVILAWAIAAMSVPIWLYDKPETNPDQGQVDRQGD